MWGKILSFASKYGSRPIDWAWKNKAFLLQLGSSAFDFIARKFG